MYVLFDLDQTLIASAAAEDLRRRRDWPRVYALVPQLSPYPGVDEMLKELRTQGTKVCIVTSAPSSYCTRVIRQWGWQVDSTVCYHDTATHKPDPAPILEALYRLGADASEAVSVGDSAKDIIASRRAGVYSVGALWGALDQGSLLAAAPDATCRTVTDLRDLLARWRTVDSDRT